MGKYIKYFEDENAFAEWLNFGEKEEGPDGAPSASVAYVGSIDAMFYDNSDVSQYEILFQPQNSEIEATSETVTFDIKTGGMWLDVYHNGELVGEYGPGEDSNYRYSVDANMTPLTVQEVFTGQWFKDNNNEKGEFVQSWDRSVTHEPDPYADPVKLQCYVGFDSDGQTPTRLGYGSLTGATRVFYEDNGTEVDILNDIYIQSKRAWYQFSAQGEYNVCFEFEGENQTVGDLFIYSQGKYLDIYTNYPELAEQTNFRFNGPLMQSSIEELTIGEGMLSVNGFLMANSLNHIILEDQNKLPELFGGIFGVAAEGTVEANSRDVENFSMWENALPSGWTMLPEPGPSGPAVTVVGTFITTTDGERVDVPSYDGGNWSYAYIDGDESNILTMYDRTYTFATAGEHTITYVRESDDTYLQDWFNATDAVSVDASGSTTWGCHGNDYYQSTTSMVFADNTQLTGATFDENCDRIGSSCFSGCTALVYLAFNNPSGVSLNGEVYPFDTITANQGVLHIPSGSQSAYADLITALGNNWSVQDDL